jgi:hypothetical protein
MGPLQPCCICNVCFILRTGGIGGPLIYSAEVAVDTNGNGVVDSGETDSPGTTVRLKYVAGLLVFGSLQFACRHYDVIADPMPLDPALLAVIRPDTAERPESWRARRPTCCFGG